MSPALKALIVEDFAPIRQVISLLLNGIGVDVAGEAADGVEAVRLALELRPDLILLDIGLPSLNGIDVARRIRELSPHSKIVFVSQESSTDIVRAAFALGAKGYVHKSRIHSDLPSAIEAVLGGNEFVSPILASNDTETHPSLRHEVLFCSDDKAIVDHVARFISTALIAGNPAIVWATEGHREILLRELRAQDIEIDTAIQKRTFVALDVNDPLEKVLEVLTQVKSTAAQGAQAHPRIAVYSDRAGSLWSQGKTDEAVQLEQLANDLARSHDLDILCLYPVPEKDVGLESICAAHTKVYALL